MEYGTPSANLHPSPYGHSDQFNSCFNHTQRMYDPVTWAPTLSCLHGQKDYLEELLSKTATTLNALRDRQTRNERVLSAHAVPRSKRKKVQQNRWRTSKTIQTCENEERVILDCLQVCESNIYTLEALINSPNMTDPSEGLSFGDTHTDPEVEWLDWKGWTDDAPVSPFKRNRERLLPMDDVPPEMEVPGHPEARNERRPFGADITQDQGTLRAEALEFKPGAVHLRQPVTVLAKELDKLTISSFLAAKRRRSNRRSSVSDLMMRDIFRRGPGHVRPASVPARSGQSRGGSSPLGSEQGY
jgi:hypothetical protein